MIKYKVIKPIPNHKIGEIVQFFGILKDEPYSSMVKEGQYVPEIGWYWKDDVDRGKYHITNFNSYCRCEYNNIEELTEFFVPYDFTTFDGGDIYLGDSYYVVKGNKLHCWENEHIKCFTFKSENITGEFDSDILTFSTKEKAQEYIDSLQEFKVGDIVVYTRENVTTTYKEGLTHPSWFRKATNDEIISYYEQQGWVKGAKFKFTTPIRIVRNLEFDTIEPEKVVVRAECNSSYFLEDCELIKESKGVLSQLSIVKYE